MRPNLAGWSKLRIEPNKSISQTADFSLDDFFSSLLEQLTKRCGRPWLVGNTHISLKTVLRSHKSAKNAS